MTNEQKAKELAECDKCIFQPRCDYDCDQYLSLLKMAEWKDEEFSKKLNK